MGSIGGRLSEIRARIDAARGASGREVRLVAVSKGHPASAVREAFLAGQRDFGENYVQELLKKRAELADLTDLRWHFIGHLQRNKVKDVLPCRLVHTLDRAELAAALAARAAAPQDVLLEVNVAGEPQKAGCSLADAPLLARAVGAHEQLRLCGLMTIPPASDDAEASRPVFRELAELGQRLLADGLVREPMELSMGMSDDFEVAIQEGATLVRVGTAIFGPRPLKTGPA